MVEHVRTLGWIGLARSVLGVSLGGFLVYKARLLPDMAASEPWDALAFRVVGAALLVLSVLWCVQGIAALRLMSWARSLGVFVSVLDLVNLIAFPWFTALGLYALVVYRNPETVHFFASRER